MHRSIAFVTLALSTLVAADAPPPPSGGSQPEEDILNQARNSEWAPKVKDCANPCGNMYTILNGCITNFAEPKPNMQPKEIDSMGDGLTHCICDAPGNKDKFLSCIECTSGVGMPKTYFEPIFDQCQSAWHLSAADIKPHPPPAAQQQPAKTLDAAPAPAAPAQQPVAADSQNTSSQPNNQAADSAQTPQQT